MFKKVRDGIQVDDNAVENLFKPKIKIHTLANSSSYGWFQNKLPEIKFMSEENVALVIINFMNKWADHHICPKCENILLSHHGTRKCPNCDSEINETKTVRRYLKDGDYK